jgi:hypothetical protein
MQTHDFTLGIIAQERQGAFHAESARRRQIRAAGLVPTARQSPVSALRHAVGLALVRAGLRLHGAPTPVSAGCP